MIRAGLVFLIIASLGRWFVHPSAQLSANVADGVAGLLYGLSIGCLLLGLMAGRRRRSNT